MSAVDFLLKGACAFGAVCAVGLVPASATMTADFDTDQDGNAIVRGQILDDEYDNFFTIVVDNDSSGPDIGVAFDSNDPTSTTGNDDDLETPSTSGLGNDPTANLGNLLIIEENRTDTDGDGIINPDSPDDEAAGGSITFDFTGPLDLFTFHLVDLDRNISSSTLTFRLGGAFVADYTFSEIQSDLDPTIEYGDNSVNSMPLFTAALLGSQFDEVELYFPDSGAVGNITFNIVPEPASMTLLGLGLAGLAGSTYYRRRKQA